MIKQLFFILLLLVTFSYKVKANPNCNTASGFVVLDECSISIIPNTITVFSICNIGVKNLKTGKINILDSISFSKKMYQFDTTQKTVSDLSPIKKKPQIKETTYCPSKVAIPFRQLPFQERGGGLGLIFGISIGVTIIVEKELKKLTNKVFYPISKQIENGIVIVEKGQTLFHYYLPYQSIFFNESHSVRPPPFCYNACFL